MNRHRQSWAVGVAAIVVATSEAGAQLVTQSLNDGVTAEDLVVALVGAGGGASVSNVVFNGSPVAAGIFSGGTGIIGFEGGIVLGTGCISNVVAAAGRNNVEDYSCDHALPGDAELEAIMPDTFDACVLEFDFECEGLQQISFEYVFASEEYNEYANSDFNDTFAFFLNGVNVALLPGTNITVSINTVNGGNPFGVGAQNPSYFVNNECGSGGLGAYPCIPSRLTEMDGLTVVLTIDALVNPGVNHIKLAIADVFDGYFDSNVFIRANSFACLPPEQLGACCFQDGSCADLSVADCADAGGEFHREATCATYECPQPPPPLWACCLPDGTCVDASAVACASQGGISFTGYMCGEVPCPQPMQCVYSQGYWKNHPNAWPVESLKLGNVTYTKAQLISILKTPPAGGNGLVSMSHQLIATKLNAANGAQLTPMTMVTIQGADALIGDLIVPSIGKGKLASSITSPYNSVLDQYNNGQLPGSPPHCGD